MFGCLSLCFSFYNFNVRYLPFMKGKYYPSKLFLDDACLLLLSSKDYYILLKKYCIYFIFFLHVHSDLYIFRGFFACIATSHLYIFACVSSLTLMV